MLEWAGPSLPAIDGINWNVTDGVPRLQTTSVFKTQLALVPPTFADDKWNRKSLKNEKSFN